MTAVETILAPEPAATLPRTGGRQYLNAADRLMLVGHEGMQSFGHPGFICQTHLRLKGRIDAAALQVALGDLANRFFVVSSRLRRDDQKRAYWEPSGEPPVLTETAVSSSDGPDYWSHAQRLLEAPLDLQKETPISFHLLRASDGRDTLLLRFCHVLMDGKSPEWTLRLLDGIFRGQACDAAVPARERVAPADEMEAYLSRFDRTRRFRCALRGMGSQIGLPVTPVTMTPPDQREWSVRPVGLIARELDEEASRRVTDRVRRLCGFVNLTPAIAASTYRAIRRCTPHRTTAKTWYQADCPLNLRPPGVGEPYFRNFMSFIQLHIRQDALADRDEATQRLNAQMRDQLRRGIDLGNLQLLSMLSRFAPLLRSHIVTRMKRRPFTLAFGYLGPVVAELTGCFGQAVDNVYTFNAALSPPGVTLQANQFAGRINLLLSYISSAVDKTRAGQLMDEIASDLTA